MSTGTDRYDLVFVGGGPAGYVGAIRAAQLGLRTALVEQSELGGICLNWGCIPTKALLHAADVLRTCKSASAFGINVGQVSFNLAHMVHSSREVVGKLGRGVQHLLRKQGVVLYEGQGRVRGTGCVEVQQRTGESVRLEARHVVLATGASARKFPGLDSAGVADVWGYREALSPQSLPSSLLVIGAGAIGMEFASFYATLGTKVHVIESQDRVLPMEDHEISACVQAAFESQGVKISTGCSVASIQHTSAGVRVQLAGANEREVLLADKVLVSIGVTGNVDDLGLDSVPGVVTSGGFIATDGFGATGQPGIYAVGDVAGAPWLAHKASHQAMACVEMLASGVMPPPLRPDLIPNCTFCHPQIASVGMTEQQAATAGRDVRVGKFPFSGNGKAVATDTDTGFVKTLFDQATGELLGAHMVGEGVTELIHGFVIARQLEGTEAELMQVVFPHPTLSEAMSESVMAAYGRVLHG